MKSLALLAVVVGLAGCATQEAITNADAALSKQVAECRAQYPGSSHHLDREKCTASALIADNNARRVPSDLSNVLLATRAELAAELDAGQITEQQADLKQANAVAQLDQVLEERAERQRAAYRAWMESSDREMEQITAPIKAWADKYARPQQPVQIQPITCQPLGSYLTCQ